MRLTLRTLLAYLDDVLSPEQAKELGKKLGESNYASALVDRIKDVMRRRRLSAPELFGKGAGIDPNVIADYLDNELTPNEVGDVEKICLDSDVHLAEVAACHQILTLVLGEPVDVRAETRSRMYALGPVATKDSFRADDASPTISMGTGPRLETPMEPVVAATSISPVDRTLPDYLKPKSSWRQTALIICLLLVLMGWIGLLLHDQSLTSTWTNRTSPDSPIDGKGTSVAVVAPKTPVEPERPQDAIVAANAPPQGEPPSRPATEVATANQQQLDANSPRRPLPDNRPAPAPADDAPLNAAVVAKAAPPDEPADAVPAQPAEPRSLPALQLLYSSRDGRLLHWDARSTDFVVLPNRSELRPGDRLACPEPFRADVIVGEDIAQATLIGGTSLTILRPTDQAAIGFDIAQGVLLLDAKGFSSADATASDNDSDSDTPAKKGAVKSLPISIVLRGHAYLLELLTDDALCAFEVRRGEPVRFQTPPEEPGYSAALHVAGGTVRISQSDGKTEELMGPGLWPLTVDWATPVKPGELHRTGPTTTPDWFDDGSRRGVIRPKAPYKVAFEKEFDAEQPLQLTMPAIVDNPKPALSELAVKCLALTESYQPLVKALVTVEHREARLAAITGLRQWLPLRGNHEDLLQAELERHLSTPDAEAVVRLLWGFNLADAKNPAASRQLVAWLEHDQVAIRELAFFHILRLTGLKNDYSAVNPAAQRRAAVDRWNNHLDKRGGALVAP